MASTLPQFDLRRLRTYMFRLPLFTRMILLIIIIFWVLELQSAWDVPAWGALIPNEINLGTMYRLNTYPLVHSGFIHTLLNALALVPLLERFEAEHGTLLSAALFFGPLSTLPAAAYLLVQLVILRSNVAVTGASVWIFLLLGSEAIKAYKVNPYFAIGDNRIPTWTTPLAPLIFVSALVPNTSFLGHICGLAIGYVYGLGYLKILAPPEKVLRWIEGRLNLLGRLPHYVSIDQKTYGRYGVLPTTTTPAPVSSENGGSVFNLGSTAPTILALRRDPRVLKIPPYLSAFCILVGVVWLFLLPLNEYSRYTYISENALLPGQVHTYFGGSEQHVFNAYKSEVEASAGKSQEEISLTLSNIFESTGLRPATQKYAYQAPGRIHRGENVYAILNAPRGDATEAIVLVAAWENMDGELNQSGVALVLTLARYFTRWSLWSKDIIILITSDSRAGPQAWVDAYHNEDTDHMVSPLPIKSGALQGVVVVDYALNHTFDSLHIAYDGINGQLPNLDLFNTAVSIASGQMGIGVRLQRMWNHSDSYTERVQTVLRGMVSQGLGHSSGPHSSFIPYHVDAITLQAIGNGPQDEMAMGRVVESVFRSLNNLLEHFHQSFFFYLLMQTDRFVSIGTYLPSAMLVAANFSIMAIALWVRSGRPSSSRNWKSFSKAEKSTNTGTVVIEKGSMTAVASKESVSLVERELFVPIALVVGFHFLGVVPLWIFNNFSYNTLSSQLFITFTILNLWLPTGLAQGFSERSLLTQQHQLLLQCFSLLLLGMFLATLATLNFSLSLFVGLLSSPLSFVGPPLFSPKDEGVSISRTRKAISTIILQVLSPPMMLWLVCWASKGNVSDALAEGAFGWHVNKMWTQVVVWCVWWPAWLAGSILVSPRII